MDNEERIRAWREKRAAGILPTDPQATAMALAFSRSAAFAGDPGVTARDIVRLALDALAAFPNADMAQRRALFARMTEGVRAGAKDRDLSRSATEFWTRRVTLILRIIETDIRRGIDVLAQDYVPEGLAETDAKVRERFGTMARRERDEMLRERRRRATREDVAHVIDLPPADAADLAELRSVLTRLHATQRETGGQQVPRIQTILPLFLLRLLIIQGESRIALLWTFLGPAMMATILASVYFVYGMHFILGMDAPSFSISGMVTWYMFRMIVFRSSESYFKDRPYLNLEPPTPIVFSSVTAILYLFVYIGILFIMIAIGHAFGALSVPDDVPGVIASIAGVAVAAWAVGLVFAGIASRWHFFLRLAPPIERFLQLFSSVYFVSEQFPAAYRKYILWWPLSHGFQFLRMAYFSQYRSTDANMTYYVVSLLIFAIAGLAADRLARSNVQPV